MKVKTSRFVESYANTKGVSVEQLRENFSGCCVDFAGELCDFVPGSRLAYFEDLKHPAWKYHAAMEFDGWIHDLWYPMLPVDTFMVTIGASKLEYTWPPPTKDEVSK